MVVYVAGKYSGDIDANIALARSVAIELWEEGHAVICPHLNTQHMEVDCKIDYEAYLQGDFRFVERCDAIVMLENWKDSKGAVREHSHAEEVGVPIYYYPDIPKVHPTEIQSPKQSRRFIQTVMRMYRTHLDKNADYSPANILGTGEIGLITRLWDKMARLMNLSGFHIQIAKSELRPPRSPKNESIDDTYLDLSVYAIIGKLLREDSWGK